MSVEELSTADRILTNIRYRIQEQIEHFGGNLPERHAIAWAGYLAALFEEQLLDYAEYALLADMLPEISMPNPIADIFVFEPNNPLLRA